MYNLVVPSKSGSRSEVEVNGAGRTCCSC
uniref:Uncharacterized protein n=1 Tax=Lotus japonicus TaxID=34305 RepID=I3SML0_LOTJA|nr:unknown [Lotus japonicus]